MLAEGLAAATFLPCRELCSMQPVKHVTAKFAFVFVRLVDSIRLHQCHQWTVTLPCCAHGQVSQIGACSTQLMLENAQQVPETTIASLGNAKHV